jgi:hypothetical protein
MLIKFVRELTKRARRKASQECGAFLWLDVNCYLDSMANLYNIAGTDWYRNGSLMVQEW